MFLIFLQYKTMRKAEPNSNTAPYVLFDDLPIAMEKWAKTAEFQAFDRDFVQHVGSDIQQSLLLYFKNVYLIDSASIKKHLQDFAISSPFPVLSMSPLLSGGKVEDLPFSRCCAPPTKEDQALFRYIGRHPRYEATQSYAHRMEELKLRFAGQRVNIVDDIIFSGESMIEMIENLRRIGAIVDTVCTNVIREQAYQALLQYNVKIYGQYRFDSVVDIVCSRDFIFGIPDGGLNYLHTDGSLRFCTYIEPFGDAKLWASIPPKNTKHFSYQMLALSHQFWTMMESTNNTSFTVRHLLKEPAIWPVETQNIANGLLSIMNEFTPADKLYAVMEHAANDRNESNLDKNDALHCAAGMPYN